MAVHCFSLQRVLGHLERHQVCLSNAAGRRCGWQAKEEVSSGLGPIWIARFCVRTCSHLPSNLPNLLCTHLSFRLDKPPAPSKHASIRELPLSCVLVSLRLVCLLRWQAAGGQSWILHRCLHCGLVPSPFTRRLGVSVQLRGYSAFDLTTGVEQDVSIGCQAETILLQLRQTWRCTSGLVLWNVLLIFPYVPASTFAQSTPPVSFCANQILPLTAVRVCQAFGLVLYREPGKGYSCLLAAGRHASFPSTRESCTTTKAFPHVYCRLSLHNLNAVRHQEKSSVVAGKACLPACSGRCLQSFTSITVSSKDL